MTELYKQFYCYARYLGTCGTSGNYVRASWNRAKSHVHTAREPQVGHTLCTNKHSQMFCGCLSFGNWLLWLCLACV